MEAPKQNGRSSEPEPKPPMSSHTPSWVRRASRACMHHLSGPVTPLLVACVCLAIVYKNRKKRPVPPVPPVPKLQFNRSLSMSALHGGKVTLTRIMDLQKARVDEAVLADAERHLHDLLAQEHLNFKKMHKAAAKLEMSGKEDVAIEMLQKALDKAEKDEQPHEAHELEMLLVEMLIYKGNYPRALKCKCIKDREISDARGPLYEAVIYTIMGDEEKAKKSYEEFQDIRSRFYSTDSFIQSSPLQDVVRDFSKFKGIVNNLRLEIDHAHKTKTT